MTNAEIKDLEIVGFNGAPLVECGRSLPVARRKSDGCHCVLQIPKANDSISFYSPEEAESYASLGRWTKIRSSLVLPMSCLDPNDGGFSRQPIMIYANDKLLDQADRVPRPDSINGEKLIWRRLVGYDDSIQAACGSEESIEQLLNEWAQSLMNRFDSWYYYHRDREYLKHLADFTLCAAKSRELRWKAYLRFASVQEPEKVRRTFDAFTRREFPDVEWEDYLKEIKALQDVLKYLKSIESSKHVTTPNISTKSKLRNLALVLPNDIPSREVA